MAYKVFTNGSTLQASELNENLMQQSVATFSNASARTAAITSPVEGQMTYLLDTDQIEVWSGSAWVRRVSTSLPFAMSAGTAATTGVTAITLPASRFTQAPIMNLTPIFAGAATSAYFAVILSSSTSSFSAYVVVNNGSLGNGNIHWTAVQMTSAASAG